MERIGSRVILLVVEILGETICDGMSCYNWYRDEEMSLE